MSTCETAYELTLASTKGNIISEMEGVLQLLDDARSVYYEVKRYLMKFHVEMYFNIPKCRKI